MKFSKLLLATAAPVLFSILPVLSLYNQNKRYYDLDTLVLPLLATALLGILLFGIYLLLTFNPGKAGLCSSLFSILFFTYGKTCNFLEGIYYKLGSFEIGANKILLSAELLIIVVFSVLIARSSRKFQKISTFLFISSLSAVLFTAFSITCHVIFRKNNDINNEISAQMQKLKGNLKPDIYYIILDGYARFDILQNRFDYHDSSLISSLKSKGFYVASQATSNYCQTVLSLSSSLNLNYLDNLTSHSGTSFDDIRPLKNLIWNNRVFHFLKKRGYTTISFSTGNWPTNIKTSDVWLSTRWSLDDFSNGVIALTPLPAFLKKIAFDQYDLHRKRVNFTFDKLAQLPSQSCHPFIAFAHIVSPHPPFAFSEDGSKPHYRRPFSFWDGSYTTNEYRSLYKKQLAYISSRTIETVDSILKNSPNPPVIIIQSDHGPGSKLSHNDVTKTDLPERMSILNALYIPQPCSTWQQMSPVNTFRVVFNSLFNAGLELKEDKSNFSTWREPYKFIDVTGRLNKSQDD